MKIKRGQLAFVGLSIIGLLALVFIALFFFSKTFKFTILGLALGIMSFIVLLKLDMKENIKVTLFLLLLGGSLILIFSSGILQSISLDSNTKLAIAIPHQASFRCDVVGSSPASYIIPLSGFWISKDDVGFNTNQITNIILPNVANAPIYYGGGGVRIHYKICDQNKNNCQDYYKGADYTSNPPSGLSLDKESMFIQIESRPTILSSWKIITKQNDLWKVSYSFDKFGLRLYSTTKDPAGQIICESSCDLTCPTQFYREKLVGAVPNILEFYQTAPYLESWESIDYDLNTQGGASVYDGSKFCLGNAIYTKDTIIVGGVTYIYPNMATKQQVQCCNGAIISSTYEDKICENNKWKTITKDTKIRCNLGDYQCPNGGQNTCQNKVLGGWSCSGSDNLGRYCIQQAEENVNCCFASDCDSDQTCQNNKCVGGNIQPPLILTNNSNTNNSNNNESKCKIYESEYTKIEKDYGLLYWRAYTPFVKPITTETKECKLSNLTNALLIAGVIIILGSVAIISNKPSRRKK
jgi:hypothetical protein